MITTGLIAVLLVWALASIAFQLPMFQKRLGRINPLGLLPNWYLFTGRLLGRDFELSVRSRADGEPPGEWQAVPVARPRARFAFLWHPERRLGKALLDAAMELVALRLAGARHRAPGHPAYRFLCEVARARSGLEGAFQFAVRVRDPGDPLAPPEALFVSPPVDGVAE